MQTRMHEQRKASELRAIHSGQEERALMTHFEQLKQSLMRTRAAVQKARQLRDAEEIKCGHRKAHLDFQLAELVRVRELLTLLTSKGATSPKALTLTPTLASCSDP